MKKMKRLMCMVLAGLIILSMAACGGSKPQTAVLTYEANGVTMEYKIDAKGDTINTITQTSSIDCSAYSEDDIATIQASMDEYAAIYEAYDGVKYETAVDGTTLKEIITLDVSDSDLVQSLSDAGLLPIEGDGTKLSLDKTVENLESQGWTLQE